MKFAQLGAGKKAENPVSFPIVSGDGETIEVKCIVIPLSGTDDTIALTFANEYAKKNGGEPKEGDPHWDLAYMAKVCEIACLDPDSPEKARERTFSNVDEALSLPRPTLAFVFELQQYWQDQCSPTIRKIGPGELLEKVRELAQAENELPFLRLSPALRWICMRFTASQLVKLLAASLLDSSSFEKSGPTSSEAPKSDDVQKPSDSENKSEPPQTTL